jgi:hypothetical protein
LVKKQKAKLAREERATGEGGEELTEREHLLEELMQIEEETEMHMEEENVLCISLPQNEIINFQ